MLSLTTDLDRSWPPPKNLPVAFELTQSLELKFTMANLLIIICLAAPCLSRPVGTRQDAVVLATTSTPVTTAAAYDPFQVDLFKSYSNRRGGKSLDIDSIYDYYGATPADVE